MYRRIIVKLSGESLAPRDKGACFAANRVDEVARALCRLADTGVQLGVVMGGVVLGGLAQKFGVIVVSMSGGNIFLALCLVGLVGAIIGMGATQTATYILMSLIVVPGLVTLGVNIVLANVIAFWFSAVSNVTPPVCVSAFAGASIAGADPMKTGFIGVIYSFMLFVLPFTFYYFPELLLQGASPFATVYSTLCLMMAIPMVAAGIMGYLVRPMSIPLRVIMALGGLLVFIPETVTDIIGLVVCAVVFIIQKKGAPKNTPAAV